MPGEPLRVTDEERRPVSSAIENRLAELGLSLPPAAAPAANYLPWTIGGGLLFVAGQLPFEKGEIAVRGRLGADVGIEDGQRAARLCALNILAQAKAALGDLGRIKRCLKVGGFVACTPEFFDHPTVINGASDLLVAVLGDAGRHARFAVGAPSLPRGTAVEVDAVFEIG
jgi:enamine deaminase RidA (YjgF/YER057c/UK114 family)